MLLPIDIEVFSMSPADIKNGIYGVPASHQYDVLKDSHKLKIWEKSCDARLNFSHLIFHELTHAYDTDRYAKKNKIRYAAIKGYSEFHAAQIEMLKLIGAPNINNVPPFLMDKKLKVLATETTVVEYLRSSQNTMSQSVQKYKYDNDISRISTILGLIFNHLGRITICQRYAINFKKYQKEFSDNIYPKEYCGDKYNLIEKLCQNTMTELSIECLMGIYLQIVTKKSKCP